eukprot:CAMPEP_0206480598 /NCGR_PEP_ID=MMETSP0324_2-20121206/37477_1 /ASSEMBLY_ACC=CAM_ASM_000836 /TAXON_ID=2866 /ORGANISM="Crypthecodinium cohnii, Strain Seligo" /LENGTH=76 /DNA_ID=CAMNT_0053957591 /DNA_START=238 /DNA_END=467 /DNA_ORIENTATION=-
MSVELRRAYKPLEGGGKTKLGYPLFEWQPGQARKRLHERGQRILDEHREESKKKSSGQVNESKHDAIAGERWLTEL